MTLGNFARTLRHDIGPAVYDECWRFRNTLDRFGIVTGGRRWATAAYLRHTRHRDGVNVLNREWDVLVVLDACRYDEFRRIAPEYEFVTELDSIISTGSATYEWGPTVFSPPDGVSSRLDRIGYVTANPYSDNFVTAEDIGYLDEVWRYAWDAEWGSVRPRAVTDRAIAAARNHETERLVVHYLQPHSPFVDDDSLKRGGPAAAFRGGDNGPRAGWGAVQRGEYSLSLCGD